MNESILINKNRGWRGLAEVKYLDEDHHVTHSMIFSFSQRMWDNMLRKGKIVIQTPDKYIVASFDPDRTKLPRLWQQRSVLIKNVIIPVKEKREYSLSEWQSDAHTPLDYVVISDFNQNTNNHTTSNWNCIGIRVTPEI